MGEIADYYEAECQKSVFDDYHTKQRKVERMEYNMEKKYVRIEYLGYTARQYDFWTDLDLQVGDHVVADSIRGLGIAVVKEVLDFSDKANKWIVQKIDLTAHEERLAREENLKLLKKKMEQRKKDLQEIAEFEAMADNDDTMAELVDAYKKLKGVIK